MPINLIDLSRIGFGAYRISTENAEHGRALLHALRSGCNLIDTSANYTNGGSENVIGAVLSENPDVDAFVITKAGYIQGRNLDVIAALNERGMAREGLISFSKDYKYSIHPDFLRAQIEQSCRRLQREALDGFLLHNPEHYFEQQGSGPSNEEYYGGIERAFEFLEDLVDAGTIRYYGISSNTLPLSPVAEGFTDLRAVVKCAERVSSCHHFKFAQFPFNMLEMDAIEPHQEGASLIEHAKSLGVVTLSNRPFNANAGNTSVRIATYENIVSQCDEERDRTIFTDCVELVQKQLERRASDDNPMDFTVMRFLRDSWMGIDDPDVVVQIFTTRFYPFIKALYDGVVPREDADVYKKLQQYAELYARRNMTVDAMDLRQRLIVRGDIGTKNTGRLTQIACETYLDMGIDHVLVGMKRPEYVDDLKGLFRNAHNSYV
jgi:aryl-alcohol dehydrogenase-like predicted oxidoreductase